MEQKSYMFGEKTEVEREIEMRRNYLGISDEEDFGCVVTDEERIALFQLKMNLRRRISTIFDEEVRNAVRKIKTDKRSKKRGW